MIPPFVQLPGSPFAVLPPGIHWATMEEIEARFGQTERRAWLFEGVLAVTKALRKANCAQVFLDGSFVTEKLEPNDFDGCWDATGVSATLLDPVLLDFANGRANQKQKYRGEMFVAGFANLSAETFLDFFQRDRFTGAAKGIVGIKLKTMEGAPQ